MSEFKKSATGCGELIAFVLIYAAVVFFGLWALVRLVRWIWTHG